MKKYVVDTFQFNGFGFPVVIYNVVMIDEGGENDYPLINFNTLKRQVADQLISSSIKLTGSQLEFLRTLQGKSLLDFANDIGVSHTQINNWEDNENYPTGMTMEQEKLFRIQIHNFLQKEKSEEITKKIINNKYQTEEQAVIEINKTTKKDAA